MSPPSPYQYGLFLLPAMRQNISALTFM